ncbi:glutamate-gated chloride channel [Trichonephila clavipes]|nr:glutamate-gated chloride channel [Trichonephila clavipes]
MKRQYGYYLTQIFVPFVLLVAVSWLSLWLDARAVILRLSLILVLLFMMIMISIELQSLIPAASYTKAIDIWIAVCISLVFATLLQFILVNQLARRERRVRIAENHATKKSGCQRNGKQKTYKMQTILEKCAHHHIPLSKRIDFCLQQHLQPPGCDNERMQWPYVLKSFIREEDLDSPIQILIEAYIAGKVITDNHLELGSGLTAFETKLGWTVIGRENDQSLSLLVTSMLLTSVCIPELWALDSLGITNPSEKKTTIELQATMKQNFLDTRYRTLNCNKTTMYYSIDMNFFYSKDNLVALHIKYDFGQMTAAAGSDVVQSGRPIFDDFFQHLWPYIGNNTANVVFQMVKRLWLIRIDQ